MAHRFISVLPLLSLLLTPASLRGEPLVIRGVVESAPARTVAEARVELIPILSNYETNHRILEGRPVEAVEVVVTNAGGRFHLAVPQPGLWRVRLGAPGFVPVTYAPIAASETVELPPVTLAAAVTATIEVRRTAGTGIAGVWVHAASSVKSPAKPLGEKVAAHGWRAGARTGVTDENGRLVLPRAAGEWLDLTLVAPWSARPQRVREVEGLRYVLEPAPPPRRVIEVQDAAGTPQAGVVVCLGELARPVGRSDAGGRVEIAGGFPAPIQLILLAADGRVLVDRLDPRAGPPGAPARFVLPPPAELAGRVLGSLQQRPLAGALVWISHDPGRFLLSDARGGWRLPAASAGRLWVQAESAGFLPRAVDVEPPHRAAGWLPDLLLEPAIAGGGRVVDPRGRPISGAQIEAVVSWSPPYPRAFRRDRIHSRGTSDGDGRFELSRLWSAAHYRVTSSRPGWVAETLELSASSADRATAGSPAPELLFVLRPGQAAFGAVTDGEERPLAGVEVRVRPATEAHQRPAGHRSARPEMRSAPVADDLYRGLSDAAGRFEIAELPGPRVTIEAAKRGFAPLVVPGVEVEDGAAPVDLGTLVLAHGAVIEGRVTDIEGTALDGVAVWAAPDFGPSPRTAVSRLERRPPTALSDAAGFFAIEDLVSGRKTAVLFHRRGHLPRVLSGVTVPGEEPLAVVLHRTAAFGGRVVDEAGQPVAGAEVSLRPRLATPGVVDAVALEGDDEHFTTSDVEGRFAMAAVTPGEYEIDACATDFQPSETRVLAISEDGEPEDLLLVLHPGAVLRGQTLSPDGEPLPGAQVIVGQATAFSDAHGDYRVAGIPPGLRTVEGRHRHLARVVEEIEIEIGDNALDLVFNAGHPVSGRVVDPSGAPAGGVRLSLLGDREVREVFGRSAADGAFQLPEVADGVYTLRAGKRGYATTEMAGAVTVAGAPVSEVEVVLEPGGSIGGQVLGLGLDDLERLEIRAECDGRPAVGGTVDHAGSYRVRDLGPGDWLVRATVRQGSRQAVARVALGSGDEVRRDLEFDRGLVLSGLVLSDGAPSSRTRVALTGHDVAVRRQVETDHEGVFTIEDLKPGRYRLDASNRREMLVHNQDLELDSDREVVIEITAARVSGQVTAGPGSEPAADALVMLHRQMGPDAPRQGSLFTVGTDGEGRFRFARLTPGRYRVTVKKDGYATLEDSLEVASDIDALSYTLTPTSGLTLAVRLASGRRPHHVHLGVFEAGGQPVLVESRRLDGAGRAFFPTVPAGTWDVLVGAPGGAPASARVTVPGEPAGIVLADAGRLKVRLPALVESELSARLSLADAHGRPFRSFDGATGAIRRAWRVNGGTATVDGVPPGAWTVRVVAADGATWQGEIISSGAAETEIHME